VPSQQKLSTKSVRWPTSSAHSRPRAAGLAHLVCMETTNTLRDGARCGLTPARSTPAGMEAALWRRPGEEELLTAVDLESDDNAIA
jgi:hypothetical protein